jgi:hypothetical protein
LPVEFEATNLDLLLAQLRPSWDQRIAAGDRALLWLPPDQPLITICDPRLLAEGLDLLVAWRAEESARGATIRVAWWNESGTTHLLWEEATRPDQPLGLPTPLSVPILVRILAAHRGAVHVSRHTGVQIELEWPTDPRTPSHPASSDLSA